MAEPDTEAGRPFRGRATIRDIADLSGVSIATVSRALNGRPDVAPETREAVLRVARQQGFSTRREPQAASQQRGLITLVLPRVGNAAIYSMIRGVIEAADEIGVRILLSPEDGDTPLLERLKQSGSEGAILMLPVESAGELRLLQGERFPVVVVDPRERPPEGVPFVAAMHAAGARRATEHLLQLGHRRIGAIAPEPGSYATEEQLLGFKGALEHAGIGPDRELIVRSGSQVAAGAKAAARLLSLDDSPTAILGLDGNVAIGALHAAHESQLRVPGDLSVVGFADPEQAELTIPPLTSVSEPRAELGRMSVALLTRLLESQTTDPLGLELSTRLVIRESTAAPTPPLT